MSVRDFAKYLGVTDRMVSKWEIGGEAIIPRPVNQAALDTCLARAPAEVRRMVAFWPPHMHSSGQDTAQRWTVHVVLDVRSRDEAASVGRDLAILAASLPTILASETTISPTERPLCCYRLFE
jgi:hypothetical protein